jgi:hypothetical protein
MDYSDINSEEDEELFQPTTNEESVTVPNYRKWLNSNTDISHISSIFRLEQENLNERKSESGGCLKGSKKGERLNEDIAKEKNDKKFEEEIIETDDDFSEKEQKKKSEEENSSEEGFEDSNNSNNDFYTFVWDEGGNDLKITGSFCNWKNKFQMTRDQNSNIFKIQLPLENGTYQYKFIVDGKWKYSKKNPTVKDEMGNINNYLKYTKKAKKSVTSKEKNKEKQKKSEKKNKKTKKTKNKKKNTKERRSSNKTKTEKTRASTINKEMKMVKKNSIYQNEYPSDDDILPLPLPNKRYYEFFKLESFTNQSSIGNKLYYDYYDRYCFSYIASSKPIFLLGHVNLNHLISVNHNQSNMLKNSMSFRYREKASTFIYYKYK